MNTNDGGYAFPAHFMSEVNGKPSVLWHGGMTLRDWFAGQVLPHIWTYSARLTGPVAAKILAAAPDAKAVRAIAESPDLEVFDSAVNSAIVEEAYRVADVMLAARNGGAK